MSDTEDRPENIDGSASPEQPAADPDPWRLPPEPAEGENTPAPEQAAAAAESPAPPAAPEPVASDPVAPADLGPAAAGPDSMEAPEQPVTLPRTAPPLPREPVTPAVWAAAPPVADAAGPPEPVAPALLPGQVAGEGPTAPGQPATSGRWSPPPAVPADPRGADQGWPEPSRQDASRGLAPPPGTPPRPPIDDHPPHGQSRNPVDRLTRGLPHPLRVTIDWIVTIVGAVAIVLLVKAFVVNPYRIPSSSMETTLHCAQPAVGCEARFSDRVLANRFLYRLRDPRRGEIIVFKTPPAAQLKCGAGGTFVKRLIALPGETVELKLRNGDGYVYINGKPLKEPYIEKPRRGAVQSFGPVKVKPGNYFMMGDNRSQSCDSRMWGTVPRANLIGKVFATYWPPNRASLH